MEVALCTLGFVAGFLLSAPAAQSADDEIDPSDRAWTGGIYDEARRGWLFNLERNEAARKAFRQNEWNHFRIECKGDSIRTWLNGVPAADLKDGLTPSGLIALQVHGVVLAEETRPGSQTATALRATSTAVAASGA